MRLLITADFHEGQTLDQIDASIASVVQYCGVDTLGGLLLHNDDFWPNDAHNTATELSDQEKERLDLSVEIKILTRTRGMAFFQPLIKLQPDAVIHNLQNEVRKRGWSGNYLLLPSGWKFVAPVDLVAIERRLTDPDCNYIWMPTEAEETSIADEPQDDFVYWEYLAVPHDDPTPVFGKFEAFLNDNKANSYVYSNGGHFKRVVEKA